MPQKLQIQYNNKDILSRQRLTPAGFVVLVASAHLSQAWWTSCPPVAHAGVDHDPPPLWNAGVDLTMACMPASHLLCRSDISRCTGGWIIHVLNCKNCYLWRLSRYTEPTWVYHEATHLTILLHRLLATWGLPVATLDKCWCCWILLVGPSWWYVCGHISHQITHEEI